jgi:hypothetical protein
MFLGLEYLLSSISPIPPPNMTTTIDENTLDENIGIGKSSPQGSRLQLYVQVPPSRLYCGTVFLIIFISCNFSYCIITVCP